MMENPIKVDDDWGCPYFRKAPNELWKPWMVYMRPGDLSSSDKRTVTSTGWVKMSKDSQGS